MQDKGFSRLTIVVKGSSGRVRKTTRGTEDLSSSGGSATMGRIPTTGAAERLTIEKPIATPSLRPPTSNGTTVFSVSLRGPQLTASVFRNWQQSATK